MRVSNILFTAIFSGLALTGAGQAAPEVTLGSGATLGGGIFSTGGGLTVVVEPHVIGGQPHLCGVWARSEVLSGYVTGKLRRVLATGVVQSEQVTLLRDFRVFRQVEAMDDYTGASANCVPVEQQPGALRVHIPNAVLERDRGEGGFVRVDFRQSAKANPAFTHGSIQQWVLDGIRDSRADSE